MNSTDDSRQDPEIQITDLLEEINERLEVGEPVDLEEYIARYPAHAERLRRLLPTLQVLADLSSSGDRPGVPGRGLQSHPGAPGAEVSASGTLGDFRISREIGRGGMGVVYEAQQISLGRRVALKVLPFAAMLDSRQLVRFQNEARAAATLDHPNIVGIYSVGCERGVHYYAMQYIEGRTLAQVIEELRASSPLPRAGEGSGVRAADDSVGRGSPDPAHTPTEGLPEGVGCVKRTDPEAEEEAVRSTHPTESPDTDRQLQAAVSTKGPHQSADFFRMVAQLGIQAAEALDHAHQLGVVHRDIKPSNLMVGSTLPSPAGERAGSPLPSPSGRGAGGEGGVGEGGPSGIDSLHLWITDFGLAMTHADPGITATGDVLGTLRYMSPEQSQGDRRRMDHRTDIYSLGVTLYELVTLQPAFPGDDRETVLRQLSEDDPPSPRRLNPSIPKDLETIILKAMAKEPEQRYATAQEMADDLKRFLAHEPIRARRPSLRRRLGLWARRHRPLVAAGVTAVAIVTLVLAIGFVRWEQERAALVELVGVVREDLEQVAEAIDKDRLPEARQALERAEGRLAAGGPGWLIAQAEDQRRDLEMVANLDEAQLAAAARTRDLEMVASLGQAKLAVAAGGHGGWDWKGSDRAYAAAFASYGLDVLALNREEAVRRLQDSAIRKHLVSALDHWAYVRSKLPGQSGAGLGALAQDADDHPWRREVRKARLSKDQPALHRLAEAPKALDQPPVNLHLLARSFDETPKGKQAAERLLRRAQQCSPGDFWLSFELGWLLDEEPHEPSRLAESVGFYRAAVALRPGSSVAHDDLGFALSEQGKLAEGIEEFRFAIKLDPNHALAHSNLGTGLYEQGKLAEAIEEFRQAIKLNPDLAVAHSNLGAAENRLGNRTEAIQEIRLALKIKPNEAPGHTNLGNALRHQGKLAEAAEEHRLAIKLKPDLAGAHSNLGSVLNEQGKPAEAIEEFRQAIKLKPDLAEAHNNLGFLLDKQGKPAEAIEEIRQAIKLKPDLAEAHYNLGTVWYQQGKPAEAIEEFRQAIKLKPDYAVAHYSLGSVLDDQGKPAEAIEELRVAIKLKPDFADAHVRLGNVLHDQGKPAEAIEEFCVAIRINPDAALAHFNLGNVLRDQGKSAEAIEEYRLAVKLEPNDADAHCNLGAALAAQGKVAEAIEGLRVAIRINPAAALAHNNLAWHLATAADPKLRHPAEAVRLAGRAVELLPKRADCWGTLGAAKYRAGDWKGASDALHKSMALASGGDAFEWFFLAMAHGQLKDLEEARRWYDQAVAWMEKNQPKDEELLRFRAEAAELLGISVKPPAAKESTETKPKVEGGKGK